MLTEFLKSIRGEKALWETIITGVDVCNFRLQGNTNDPFIPISLQPLHFEVFFCFAGHVVLKQQWNRVVVVRKQEILLLSGISSLYSVACTADLAGVLVSVDAAMAKESLYSLCRMMGDLKLNTLEVKKYMDEQDGCAVIHGSSWVFSAFSEIVKMEDLQKSRYCVWKSVELLFLLSTGTLYPKDKDNLKISKVIREEINEICNYMEMHLDEKITIDYLCHKFYISPTTLKKYFRNIYGQPVYTWLSHKRMEKAAELLCYTSMTVLEIAQAVGYSSLSQFNVVFKKCYTCTPRQYRNRSDSIGFCLFPKE